MLIRLICVIFGYAFGMIQTAFLYGKSKGIDIREHGSGNAGTTNTLRVLGTKAGLIVFAGDALKSMVAISIIRFGLAPAFPDIAPLLILWTGLGCVLGHNFPFYMNFKGGKGIATSGGMIIITGCMFAPEGLWYIVVGLIMFFGFFISTHYVSLGSLFLYTGFFVQTIIMGQMGVFGVAQNVLIEMYIVVFILTVLAFIMHRENIKRLIHGNERKTYLFKKKKMDVETNADAAKVKEKK